MNTFDRTPLSPRQPTGDGTGASHLGTDQLPSMKELFYVILSRKRMVLGIFLTVVMAATVLVFGVLSPKFEASTTVLINVAQIAMPITDGAPASDFEKLSSFQTQKDVIKSVVIASEVVDKLKLQDTRALSNMEKLKLWVREQRRVAGKWLGIAKWQKPEDPRAAAIEAVYTRLEIVSKPESQALKLIYRAYNPDEAQATLNTIIEQYSNYFYVRFQDRAQGMQSYIETRLADSNGKLAASEEAVRTFRQADKIDISELRDRSGVNSISEPGRPAIGGLTDNLQIQNEVRLYILSMEKELQALITMYSDSHPQVLDLRARIKRYSTALSSLPNKEVEWLRLKRELEANQEVVMNLRRSLERTRMFAESTTERFQIIQVIDPASADDTPVSPKPRLAMFLALVSGLLFAIMSAFVLDYLDPTIRSIRDAERSVGIRVLSSLSRL
ncbi:Polysaccharide chain length determinant N-terminal domain containing protein [Comamonadaceae bacterium]